MTRHCLSLSRPDQNFPRQLAPPSDASVTLAPPLATRAPVRVPVHDARVLTGDVGQATILLGDQAYTLRITRAGKLILTK